MAREGLKVAVVGTGRWGKNHVRVFSKLREKNLCSELIVCDVNKKVADKISKMYNADKIYYDAEDMISKEDLDCAVVSVPTLYHYEVSSLILKKADVLVEKPLAATCKEALDLIKISKEEGRILAVGHVERFNSAVLAVRDYLRDKVLNANDRVVSILTQRIGPGPPGGYTLNLGVAHDLLTHDIDVVVFLLERVPRKVVARAIQENELYESDISAIFEYEDGIIHIARASWRSGSTFKKRMLLIQTKESIIELDYILQRYQVEKGLMQHIALGTFQEVIQAYRSKDIITRELMLGAENEPLYVEDQHFLECVKYRREPLNSAKWGYIALKCVETALLSSKTGACQEISWSSEERSLINLSKVL
ncbi:MAG: hypothetical protein DRJ52_00485 [Thermoprotei archaeon]|nr:MAG: hypothetical protein DRJ52_00485 [Thermoprotei archaeon]RLF00503.1 MAG: hypothetical protein DRJ63_02345 [Thermoprotei archaeon]